MRALLLAAALTLGLAGCGGGDSDDQPSKGPRVDTADFARRVTKDLARITGTVVADVACPSGVVATPGTTFECGASFNGEADGVIVTVTGAADARDGFRLRLRNLLLGKLELAIRERFAKQKLRLASLDCPGPQPQRRGGSFRCRARDGKGRRFDVLVTQTDDAGNVTFRVVG